MGAGSPVRSCDVHILVYQVAEQVASQRTDDRAGGRGSAAGGRVLIKRSLWAVGAGVLAVLLQHRREVAGVR